MDLFKKCRDFDIVDKLKKQDVYPYFHKLETRQAPIVQMEGKEIIMLGSNNYLGLTTHPEVVEAGIKAIEEFGSGCSGSRFLNGTLTTHVLLEQELAEFLNKEDVVTFSTGFQSNLGIISCLAGRTDYIISDKENHASIYDGCRLSFAKMLRYNHSDMEDLERLLQSVPDTAGILIVTDGVFSMAGDICKLPEIVALAKKYGARVMVDDAHALGVLGEHGRGTAEFFGLEDQVDIYMGTFSKSLASLGGYMASSKEVCEYVRHNSRPFIFSASITPSSVAVARKALEILKREPQRVTRLAQLSDYMRKLLRDLGVDIIEKDRTPIIPIYTYTNMRTFVACKMLFDSGVYVNSTISPAVPVGKSLLRTSYMATHSEEHLEKASKEIKRVLDLTKDIQE